MGARRNSVISKSWLQERREILQKIKDQVRLYLGPETSDITLYASAYKKDLTRPWQASDWPELFVALEQVQVVFGGDFHPFAQAQRAHLRILRKLVVDRPLLLALECLYEEDQDLVEAFMQGRLSEDQFLQKTQWNQRWGFPWAHYKPIFDFAKKHNVKLLALNQPVDERTGTTLHARDDLAAKLIAQHIEPQSHQLIYVIYGDLHVASAHLPRALKKHLPPQSQVESATLYLNSETLYFQLAEQKREHQVEVLRFDQRHFCLLTSPPWVKWHSYLMYLEENFDVDLEFDDEDDEDDFWDEDEWEFQIDHTDHVSDLVKMISSAIAVQVDSNAIEVYSMQDPQARVVIKKILSDQDYQLAHSLIQNDRCFFIPKFGFFYLSKATVNHAATLAGQYIHGLLCGRQKLMWQFPEDFVRFIWIEAMGFMLSKFVNPKRKAQTMADLKKQLEAFDKKDRGREPLLLALDQKMLELLSVYKGELKEQAYTPREKSSYALAAKFIGEILGERYFILYEKQILGIDSIRELLKQNLEGREFIQFYYQQLKRLDRLELEGSQ